MKQKRNMEKRLTLEERLRQMKRAFDKKYQNYSCVDLTKTVRKTQIRKRKNAKKQKLKRL